jgi:hypothetical protein
VPARVWVLNCSMSSDESLRPSWKSMNFAMCHP